jgi:hypothetical protein
MSAAVGEQHGVRSAVMTDRIIGCPHEEGIDYEGTTRATRSGLAVTVHP